jgi:PAN domain
MVGGYGGPDMDNSIDMYGMGYGPGRPGIMSGTRCDEVDSYKQMGLRQKMKNQFVKKQHQASDLTQCQRLCTNTKEFVCRSFNYREDGGRPNSGTEVFNCELSDRDTRELDLNNPAMFENKPNYDFYERSIGGRSNDGECLDVSQVCNEDGMEFTLRTSEPFAGRIYSYGFYDRYIYFLFFYRVLSDFECIVKLNLMSSDASSVETVVL